MRSRRHVISVRHWRGMQIRCNWPGDVGNVGEHSRADTLGNLANTSKVDDAGIGRGAADDQFWFVFFSNALELIVINLFGFARNAVVRNLVADSGKVHRVTMRE